MKILAYLGKDEKFENSGAMLEEYERRLGRITKMYLPNLSNFFLQTSLALFQ